MAKPTDSLHSDYEVLFDQLPLPLWLISSSTLKVTRANQAAARLLQRSADGCLGITLKSLHEMLHALNGASCGRLELLSTREGTPFSLASKPVVVGFYQAGGH